MLANASSWGVNAATRTSGPCHGHVRVGSPGLSGTLRGQILRVWQQMQRAVSRMYVCAHDS